MRRRTNDLMFPPAIQELLTVTAVRTVCAFATTYEQDLRVSSLAWPTKLSARMPPSEMPAHVRAFVTTVPNVDPVAMVTAYVGTTTTRKVFTVPRSV